MHTSYYCWVRLATFGKPKSFPIALCRPTLCITTTRAQDWIKIVGYFLNFNPSKFSHKACGWLKSSASERYQWENSIVTYLLLMHASAVLTIYYCWPHMIIPEYNGNRSLQANPPQFLCFRVSSLGLWLSCKFQWAQASRGTRKDNIPFLESPPLDPQWCKGKNKFSDINHNCQSIQRVHAARKPFFH